VTDADMAAFQEGTLEVTEMAEEPVVAKQARVVEEVIVGKEATERTDTRGITETVADAVTGDRIDDKTGKPIA
jgi:stress response protein YsnF